MWGSTYKNVQTEAASVNLVREKKQYERASFFKSGKAHCRQNQLHKDNYRILKPVQGKKFSK